MFNPMYSKSDGVSLMKINRIGEMIANLASFDC